MTFYNLLFKNKSENNNKGVIHKGCPHKGGGEGVQLNVGICRQGGKGVDQMWMSTFRDLVIKFLLKAVK